MSIAPIAIATPTGTIAAGDSEVVEIETHGAPRLAFVLKAGAGGDIDAVTVEKTPLGNLYGTDAQAGTDIGTIAAGESALIELRTRGFVKVRLTLSSTAGTDYAVEAHGST